jgi:hypothetical protein
MENTPNSFVDGLQDAMAGFQIANGSTNAHDQPRKPIQKICCIGAGYVVSAMAFPKQKSFRPLTDT